MENKQIERKQIERKQMENKEQADACSSIICPLKFRSLVRVISTDLITR